MINNNRLSNVQQDESSIDQSIVVCDIGNSRESRPITAIDITETIESERVVVGSQSAPHENIRHFLTNLFSPSASSISTSVEECFPQQPMQLRSHKKTGIYQTKTNK